MTAFTQRVKVGAYYTDGGRLLEVVRVQELGYVYVRDTATEQVYGCGIAAFRDKFWLVRSPDLPGGAA